MSEPLLFDAAKLAELRELEAMTETPLVRGLLTTYLDSLDSYVTKVKTAVAASDAAAQKLAAHSLKSSSAQVGAMRLSSVCFALEHATFDTATALLPDLDREVAAIRPLLSAERDAAS